VQLLETGVLHCDPHPGNLCAAALPDAKNRLVFYDFGMMDTLGDEVRNGMRRAVLALFGGPAEPNEEQLDAAAEELMAALTQCG
jgi:predicted unusual protein kinase regulating ubiquinone biosynthesis (AarF/ABC1/UbiB family)